MSRICQLIAAASLACATVHATAGEAHVGPVTAIAVAPSGGEVYSCSQGGIFAGTGDQLRLEFCPEFRVTGLACYASADGTPGPGLLIAGGDPGVSGTVGRRLGTMFRRHAVAEDMIYAIACSPDGQHLAVAAADGKVLLCSGASDLAAGSWGLRHRHTATARAVAISPDGKWLASAGLDGVVIISSLADAESTAPRHLDEHTAGVECLAFSPDSEMLASGSRDSKVRIHLVSGKLLRTHDALGMTGEPVAARVPSRVLSIAWGPHVLIAGTSKGSLHHLSLDDDRSSRVTREGDGPISALAIDQPHRRLLIGTGSVKSIDLRELGIAD